MPSKEALAMRALRERRKQENVCIYCGNEEKVTQTMCQTCADAKRSSEAPLQMRTKKRYPIIRKPKDKDKMEQYQAFLKRYRIMREQS
ncbi:hypothetical protein DUZ99_00785 [Xylanibacillus composti]|uniref:Uncharacterized protein n=1 Tax=Xylanibacillus composti TaxID=1572762 RepID=A0A8J4H3U1_9BACL|nr:hypothetical protein [Xylanibacillus composti]MDT9723553.1 hypothetical protein [Xylanibacillus composti]GIQ68409.1 hypothetical protein XYCOK13_12330 [Xylanibacillus composti]